ncbi:DUF2079 domain-containing protein [Patescibacteria group bacterium]|nr:DUF2079 domain-containing protein [Patescibacteria group bacterium]
MYKVLKRYIDSKAAIFLTGFIILYILLFSFLSLKKYYNFAYNVFDLAIFNQVFFNTLQGRWFDLTINLNNYLADHFALAIIFLIPFYAIHPGPEILLVIQSFILALCAWPIYLIAELAIGKKHLALFISLLWLINPFVHNANLFEFHMLPLAIFFIFFAFYFYYKKFFGLFILFMILSLLVREDIALMLLGFLPLAILDKRSLKWKMAAFFVPILYFILAMLAIGHIADGQGYKFVVYYSWIIEAWKNPWTWLLEVFAHIFTIQNIGSIFVLLITLFFIPILKPKYFWLAFVPLIQFVLAAQGFNSIVYSLHYVLVFLPAIFIAFIFSVRLLLEKKIFLASNFIYKNKDIFVGMFLVAVVYFSIFLSPVKDVLAANFDKNINNVRYDMLKTVGRDSSVIASLNLLPQLSQRQVVYPFSYAYIGRSQFYINSFDWPLVDYIILDYGESIDILQDSKWLLAKDKVEINLPEPFRKKLENYNLVEVKANILLWQKRDINPQLENKILYQTGQKSSKTQGQLVFKKSEFIQDKGKKLALTFKPTNLNKQYYIIRFYTDDDSYDLPIDYGLFPDSQWQDREMIFFYYLEDRIKSFQIFAFDGVSVLDKKRSSFFDMKTEALSKIIYLDL